MKFSKFLSLVTTFAPVILSSVKGGDKIAPIVPVIVHGIQEAEQIKGASGADKKAHVLATAADAVTALNSTGKVKLDPAEVQDVASKGIDLTIQVVKDVHGAGPQD